MILAFAHPAIVVPSLEDAKEFYCRMFNMKVLSKEGWQDNAAIDEAIGCSQSICSGYTLADHNCCIELFQFDQPQFTSPAPHLLNAHESGLRHIAFYVDDCFTESLHLKQLGGSSIGEPVTFDNGASVAYCRDPFGNIIELCEIPNPEENPVNLLGISRLNNDFEA